MIWTLSLSNTSRLIHVSEPRRLLHQPVSADWHLPGGLWSSFQSSLQFHRSYHSQHGWSCNVRGSWAARGDADGGEKKTSHTVLKSCDNGVKQYFTSMLSGNRKREDTWSVSIISLSLYLSSLLCVGVQQEHTDTVQRLRFMLDFARCLMEVAGARGAAFVEEQGDPSPPSVFQQQSMVADQISSLSREWR